MTRKDCIISVVTGVVLSLLCVYGPPEHRFDGKSF